MIVSRVRQLHERALRVAQAYLGAEAELIEILQGMDETKGYRNYGAKSLFEYATKILKLSTATTFNLTTVARKSKEIPALKEAIRAGTLTLSKARKTVPVLTAANQAKWIGLAQTLTSRELEQEVAMARQLGNEHFEDSKVNQAEPSLSLKVSKVFLQKIERIKILIAHKESLDVNLAEALEIAVDAFLEKNDPLWVAKFLEKSASKEIAATVTGQQGKAKRPAASVLPIHLRNIPHRR